MVIYIPCKNDEPLRRLHVKNCYFSEKKELLSLLANKKDLFLGKCQINYTFMYSYLHNVLRVISSITLNLPYILTCLIW